MRFDTLTPVDWPAILTLLLPGPSESPGSTAAQVRAFQNYLADFPGEYVGWRSGLPAAPRAICLALLIPGATATIMIPEPGLGGIDPAEQLRLTAFVLGQLEPRRLHYVQALLEPKTVGRQGLLARLGFQPLAPLIYLERDARYPWVDPPEPGALEWTTYGPDTHALFAQVVLATYQDSQDCPELTGLRPIDDVLAAHKASGPHDPSLWYVALARGRPVGCLLLGRVARGELMEIVYVGVVPDARRSGVAKLLLRQALHAGRTRAARRITVAVDGRNAPAQRLYAGFNFTFVAQRDAYWYRFREAKTV